MHDHARPTPDSPFPAARTSDLSRLAAAETARIEAAAGAPVKLSRRLFMGAAGLTLAVALAPRASRAQDAAGAAPGAALSAFLDIRPDGTVELRAPFVEGGQGIHTAMAQLVAEELDLDIAAMEVVTAPAGTDYQILGGMRMTGGSSSVRGGHITMRRLGAAARSMLIDAASEKLGVPAGELTTRPGEVAHEASGRALRYGDLAGAASLGEVPAEVTLKQDGFRYIGARVPRMDLRDKSTGKARYGIDATVPDMLHAAVRHAPRRGMAPEAPANRAEVEAMRGVHSVHLLPDAVAVCAERWYLARRAVEALEISWTEGEAERPMPADFSSADFRQALDAADGDSAEAEAKGDALGALAGAETVIEATYTAPMLVHGQLEPPSAIAHFDADGGLELNMPNQAPEMFQAAAAAMTGLAPEKISVVSPGLGGFFGRHFPYADSNPWPQAVTLARATGRPVKVLWTREEEFLRDAMRPVGHAKFRAALDADGMPVALAADLVGEGPTGRWWGAPPGKDGSAVEGVTGKPYAIPNVRVGQRFVANPAAIGYWRSVGHSMHDYFYESFLDELALAGGKDPMALRRALLADNPRLIALLDAVETLSGGWRPGPYEMEGTTRARGLAMASPFGSEVATIAEVSLDAGQVRAHRIWVAIDPGSAVNPSTIEAQVRGAVALGLSQTLLEEVVYEEGEPLARNFDMYRILSRDMMPAVEVAIVESGAPMGGIGEPGLPGVGGAVANAAATLTGVRARATPLINVDFTSQG